VQVLIVVVPGGPETDRLIDAAVIDALGPDGILVNVARGSVVDEAVLIAALKDGRLLAAGLDVFPDEPRVSPELISLPNVVLCPHVGSASVATRQAMGDLVLANIRNWFEGKGALNPVNQVHQVNGR
jgi:lactate dehydrogenase-like 2-hydroxyacid dehydrogenase